MDDLSIESTERARFKDIFNRVPENPNAVKERSLAKTTKLVNRLRNAFVDQASMIAWIGDFAKIDVSMYIEELVSALLEVYKALKLKDVFRYIELMSHLSNIFLEIGHSFFHSLLKLNEDNLRLRLRLRTLTEGVLIGFFPKVACLSELSSIFTSVLTSPPVSSSVAISHLTVLSYWVGKYFTVLDPSSLLLGSVSGFYTQTCPQILESAQSALAIQEKSNINIKIHHGMLDPETELKYQGLVSDVEKISVLVESIRLTMGLEKWVQLDEPVAPVAEPETLPASLQFNDDMEKSLYVDILDLSTRLPKSLLPMNLNTKPTDEEIDETELVSETTEKESLHVKTFVTKLDRSCYTQEEADDLAIYWFEGGFNSKGNRKILAKWILFETEEQVLSATQCRFLATIAPYTSDLIATILTHLKRKKTHIRSVRFLCELAKFNICPPGVILRHLKWFLDDFSPQTAELAAWVLITCGRYLLHVPEVQESMESLIVRLMKLKDTTRNLPKKIAMTVDDAYFQAKPKPMESALHFVVLSPLEKYINHLVHVEVYRMKEDEVLNLVRRLPWENPLVATTFEKAILGGNGVHVNFDKTYCIASLLTGLNKHHTAVVTDIIDAAMEEFQLGIEKEDFRLSANRVRLAKFIAELYAFRLINAELIFDTLYQLIGFSSATCWGSSETSVLSLLLQSNAKQANFALTKINEDEDEDELEFKAQLVHPGAIDEPGWSFVRTSLVCTLLVSCGEFFLKGRIRARLDRFLLLFRRYLLLRQPVPLRVRNIVADMYDLLAVPRGKETVDEIHGLLAHHMGDVGDLTESPAEESEYDESQVDKEESVEEPVHRIDMDQIRFDQEMQSLMVDALAEARTKSVTLNPLLVRPVSQTKGPEIAGAFKVLRAAGPRTMSVSNTVLVVPETHKLRQGQADFLAEQQEAARERALVKQYIMRYERGGVSETQNEERLHNHEMKERRKYRRQ